MSLFNYFSICETYCTLSYPLQASFLYCPHNMGRFSVFPEAELEYKEDAPEPFKKDQRGVHKISEAGRWKLTSSNETEDRIFDLDEEERLCPRCKGKLVWIGKELVREVFEYRRPKLKLVRYWQMSYKCQIGRASCRERV